MSGHEKASAAAAAQLTHAQSWTLGERLLAVVPSALNEAHAKPGYLVRRAEMRNAAGQATALAGDLPFERAGVIAVVNISGPLMKVGGDYGWDGYVSIRGRVEAALRDPATRAVVLRINSPGGVCAGCFDVVASLQKAKASAKKPVFAFADELAASAAYAMACVADEIYLPRTGAVGSVGVINTRVDLTKMNEEMGLRIAVVTSGARKADGHPDTEMTDEELARLQNDVGYLASVFADTVAAARGMTPEAVLALQASVLYGPAAVKAGLANGVATWDEFMKLVEKKTNLPARMAASSTENGNMVNIVIAAATLAVLGLKEGASENEVTAAIHGLADRTKEAEKKAATDSDACARIAAAAGVKTVDEALGAVAAFKASAARVTELEAQVQGLQGEVTKRDRDALIAQGEKDKKLTPALKEWAATVSVETLKAFLEKAPQQAALAAPVLQEAGAGTNGDSTGAGAGAAQLAYNGKHWPDLTSAERVALWKSDRPLFDAMRDAHEASKSKTRR